MRGIAAQFDTDVGAISSAFLRTGTRRTPQRVEPLPAEKSAPSASRPKRGTKRRKQRRSKVDKFKARLGLVPDRVIAEEANMSVQAIRNRRIKLGIPSSRSAEGKARRQATEAAPSPDTASIATAPSARSGGQAWRVTVRRNGADHHGYVVAGSISEAVAAAARGGNDVVGLALAGPMLA